MKKIFWLVALLLTLFGFSLTVKADMGPKPFISIDFVTEEKETYYVSLITNRESGPWTKYDGDSTGLEPEEVLIVEKFASYEDSDGFFFISYLQKLEGSSTFEWRYMPPDEFKILIYVVASDRFIVSSDIYQTYAFGSYFKAEVDFTRGEILNFTKNYDYGKEISAFLIRVLITILVEIGLALLFRFKGKALAIVIAVNILTQVILNLFIQITYYYSGAFYYYFYFFLLEIAVIILEYFIYYFTFGRKKENYRGSLGLYVVVANVLTAILTFFLPF